MSLSLRPIKRIKHIVDADGNVDDSPQVVVDLITAVDNAVFTVSNNVETGSTVHGVYLKVEALHTSGVGRPNFYMAVFKNPGNNIPVPDIKTLGTLDERKYIIHQEMVMLSGDASNGLPRVVFNGVIKIPKGYKRFGIKDRLQLILRTGTVDLAADWCVQCIYKEFR